MTMVFSQLRKNALDAWTKAVDRQLARTQTLLGRVAEAEAQNELAASLAVDEWARLVKETMRFQLELSHEWRKHGLGALEKVLTFGAPPRPSTGG